MRSSSRALRACDVVLRLVGVIVPQRRRDEWLREWRAELWHEAARLGHVGVGGTPLLLHLLGRTVGVLPDALALRHFHPAPAREDLGSALSVVFRSPGAAGAAIILVAIAAAVDTVAVNVMSFTALAPSQVWPYLPFVRGIALTLVVLLPLAACIAAAVTVGWSDAARREEALRRAIGVPDRRLRRQRALEGAVIALLGCAAGAWAASALLGRLAFWLTANGRAAATVQLQNGPGVVPVVLALAATMPVLMGAVALLQRKRVALE